MKSVLDVPVSYYTSKFKTKYASKIRNLKDLLFGDANLEQVQRVRKKVQLGQSYEDEKRKLPAFTPEGVFEGPLINRMVQQPSHLLCFDLDKMGEFDLQAQKKEFANLSHVAFCGLSCSGQGLFVLLYIDDLRMRDQIWDEFAHFLQELHFNVDLKTKNINRLRFVSWDEDPYVNHHPRPYPTKNLTKGKKKPQKKVKRAISYQDISQNSPSDLDTLVRTIVREQIDVTQNYSDWIRLGFGLGELGEEGREYFHQVSQFYPKYTFEEADKVYTNLMRTRNGKVGVDHIVFWLKQQLGMV